VPGLLLPLLSHTHPNPEYPCFHYPVRSKESSDKTSDAGEHGFCVFLLPIGASQHIDVIALNTLCVSAIGALARDRAAKSLPEESRIAAAFFLAPSFSALRARPRSILSASPGFAMGKKKYGERFPGFAQSMNIVEKPNRFDPVLIIGYALGNIIKFGREASLTSTPVSVA
jgi:hypothetical protein